MLVSGLAGEYTFRSVGGMGIHQITYKCTHCLFLIHQVVKGTRNFNTKNHLSALRNPAIATSDK